MNKPLSKQQDLFNRFFAKYGWGHKSFFNRPHWTRRRFFEVMGGGVTASYLTQRYAKAQTQTPTSSSVQMKNTAKNCIFILLAGAPSHTDTFDLKVVPGATPASFNPETVNGVLWPTGLLPNLGNMTGDFALVRSMQAHALVHSLAQTWTQIGRNPAAALGTIAPNIGSVVAIEKDSERTPAQVFPTFLALNSDGAVGQGYLPAVYAPFKVNPSSGGLAYTTNTEGQTNFANRWKLVHQLDGQLRTASPYGQPMDDYEDFYQAAQQLMYNPVVNTAFAFSSANSVRYGSSSTGNAMLVASQLLKSNQGTRFVQITSNDGWDMHQNIYAANALPAKGKLLDTALSALLTDLKADGLLDSTLVVMAGEFGRTVGPLTAAAGRDHLSQQFAFFAGGGIKGGTIVGQSNATGGDTSVYGWSQNRYVYPEDIEATIYSALGINWTTTRHDDPFGRGFQYVPTTDPVQYFPIHELWGTT
jgi:hypothetical protein